MAVGSGVVPDSLRIDRTTGDGVSAVPGGARPRVQVVGTAGLFLLLLAALVAAAGWHLTQGTSGVGFRDLLELVLGGDGSTSDATRDILLGSRIPRVAAAVAVGFALGVAGTLLQSLARNVLAAPDTIGVTAGAYFAVAAVSAFGLSFPLWASTAVAFVGGLAAAGLVLALAGAGGTSTTRLLLAGSAITLALQSATAALLILFEEQTTGLFAWGNGSLSQLSLTAFNRAAPLVSVVTLAALLLARRFDLLRLGDDTAAVLGVPVRSTRVAGIVMAVVLIAASVTLAGPIGFVGLAAPVSARLLARVVPALQRHSAAIPAAGLLGALIVVLADAILRALIGAERALAIPTGVSTTLAGGLVMVALVRRGTDTGPARSARPARVRVRSRRRHLVVLALAAAAVVGTALLGLLAGHTWLRTGDLGAWLAGDGVPLVRFALDERAPRVAAALAAGAALALSGTIVQAACRNPLAEPGLLGITGGAGLGAVVVVTGGSLGGGYSNTSMLLAAIVGAMVAFATVYGLSWKGGLDADRLVLTGIGLWYGTTSVTTYLLLRANPWDTPRVFTWLSGTTYGRTFDQVLPVAIVLAIGLPVALVCRRSLDLLALDEDTPRVVGLGVERTRVLLLGVAAALAATSVAAVGVVGFVGLVAPHASRALVGARHARVLPVAVLLGAVLLGLADTVGRTVIAPSQVPAGLVVAIIGTPYFVVLLLRSRT